MFTGRTRLIPLNTATRIVAVVAVALAVFFGCRTWKQSGALVEARARTEDARLDVQTANTAAKAALDYVAVVQDSANAAVKRAQAHAARAAVSPGPDSAAYYYHQAYKNQIVATAYLQVEVDTLKVALRHAMAAGAKLETASGQLVKASKPSFWGRITPKVGIGGAVGIDPQTMKFAKTVGVTLSWAI